MQIYTDKSFTNPIAKIVAFDTKSLKSAFEKLESYKNTHYLLGYIRYEAKNCFFDTEYSYKKPLLYFEVFETFSNFTPQNEPITNYLLTEKPLVSKSEYTNALTKIKNEISNGITYEVNYTYPTEVTSSLEEFELYQALLKNQTTPYNTFIKNEYETLLSFSPELFFTIKDNKITTKPMKGTIKRGLTPEEDRENIEFLKNDIKNKAENVMIVDLLRNDLSKIAKTGSVNVANLFEIETHKTVHQMTSTIEAELEGGTTLYKVFESIFPCGSITGAPKISTMRVIEDVEKFSRDIYCGAIGLITPEETVFSVPIRILQKENTENSYLCHTGGAIVWDSDIQDEWEETFIKRKFLNPTEFNLIETMKSENGEILFKSEHLSRLKNSCEKFGFTYNPELEKISSEKTEMIRIVLSKNGEYTVTRNEIKPNKTNKIIFSKTKTNSSNEFLYHKTDNRYWYDDARKMIKNGEIFDLIFRNEKEEITEGARSNIVILKDGKLYTPPTSSGLLNGCFRQKYLQEVLPKFSLKLEEKVLYKDDIINADKIYCINSVREMVEVELCL